MKKLFAYLCLSMALFLVGCAQLGVPAADTFNKKLLAGYQTVETVNRTAGELRMAGKLSDPDRDNIVTTSRSAVQALDLAKEVHSINPAGANDKLTAAITVLGALQAYIATRSK